MIFDDDVDDDDGQRCTFITSAARFAWILVVISATTVFAYAVSNRLGHLYDFPSSIDLTVGYWPRVPFPAVTICNQNSFRY